MPKLTTLETSAWVVAILCSSSTTSRQLNTNFVTHEIAFVVFGYTFFSSLAAVKFLGRYLSTNQLATAVRHCIPQNHIQFYKVKFVMGGNNHPRVQHLLKFNIHDSPNLAKTAFEILFPRVFRKTANVYFVGL